MAQTHTPEVNINEVLRQVAHEKDIDLDKWIVALEDAVASAAKKQHHIKEPVRSYMDRETGQFSAFLYRQVVEEVEDPTAEWTLEEAREHKEDAELGEEIEIPISTEGLGRIAAQSAKQVLYQRIREAEREKIFNEFEHRVGEVVNGTVRRFERGDIIVDLGRTEAIVPRSEQSRHERYSQGERIRGVIVEVHKQPKGPQVVMSRTDPRLLVKLFEMEVPEIYDGTVVIKTAVRAPGERAKVAVVSRERDVDPVGACVGMKGSRVQSIIRELRGEKIDIIEFSEDQVTFAQSALAPARITRVSVTHEGATPHLDVIVEDEQLSLAIGKRGQNVRLASELIGARIDIKSESDVKDEVADALARMLNVDIGGDKLDLTEIAGVDEDLAAALEVAGFGELEALQSAGAEALTMVPGVDEAVAASIIEWATAQASPEDAAAASDGEGPAMDEDDFMAALTRVFEEESGDGEEEAAQEVSASGEDTGKGET
ncbi:MAG: transcription termination factor NusA [Acidobacteria bacterium]|nr:transcription termination factor NusA [Acidobacteriota bacterium]MXZ37600.1 transcription termination factor NusA [Holophagales bacterium]MYF04836.1 transcription termination factor NusA [Holophagales bacterium]MYJ25837.1 transcription termination factor NusA [Holophagales bacterium]